MSLFTRLYSVEIILSSNLHFSKKKNHQLFLINNSRIDSIKYLVVNQEAISDDGVGFRSLIEWT